MNISTDKSINLVLEKVEAWYELLVKNIPNFIVAIAVLVIFILIAKVTRRVVRKIMRKGVSNQALEGLVETIVYVSIILIGLFTALGILHLDKTVTSLLAGAGVVGLALGFAFQDIAANFVSGILIAFRQPYTVGDIVEVEGYRGEVKAINLRTTNLVTFQGIEIFIPNKEMFTKPLKNYTTTPRRRLDIEVGVSYGDNLRNVEKVVMDCLEGLEGRIESEPIEVFYKEFGGSSINFDARIWINYPADKNFLKTRHEAIIRIKEAFDKNDISIPYPIRTIDFGIKGGENLKVPLEKVFRREKS